MQSFLSVSRALFLLAVVEKIAVSMPACSQQPQAGALPDVRLEWHDGKGSFYLGEPIQLDLVFQNRTGLPFVLNKSEYGDLSEKVEITPAKGWLQWQTPGSHDYSSVRRLLDTPVRIPVQLGEGFVFREPGTYRVRMTTYRLKNGDPLAKGSVSVITTNEVTIKLRAMPADVERAQLRTIRADLVSAGDGPSGCELRQSAMNRLAALQGDEALAEKIRLLEAGDEDFRAVYRQAFAMTHDLQKQLVLLQQAWTDPKLTPAYDLPDVLYETHSLLAGRSLSGLQSGGVLQVVAAPKSLDAVGARPVTEQSGDPTMVALLDSMPQRNGESRAMGAYLLIEFGGLTEAQLARAMDYVVEEFPHMDDTQQHMLLETAHPPLRDPRLVPALRSMLAKYPSDKDAEAALLAMAPAESTTWIVTSVCAPQGAVPLDTFKDAPMDRVPEVDACLAPLLRVAASTPREELEWKERAKQAARFATPAILPALREGWKDPSEDGAALAVLMRDDPTGAVALLNKEVAAGKFMGMLFYETSSVYKQVAKPFPPEVLTWLREKLESGSDKEASMAARALSIGGDASDGARLGRLHAQAKECVGEQCRADLH